MIAGDFLKLTVYLDILFITNIIINYFILKTAVIHCRASTSTVRIILSSFVGSLCSIIIFFDIPILLSVFFKVITATICTLIAFGTKKKTVNIKALFYTVAVTFGFIGAVSIIFQYSNAVFVKNMQIYLNMNPMVLIGSIVAVYIVVSVAELVFENTKKEYIYDVTVYYSDGLIKGTAFYDTGFKIKDVVTFRTVMLCNLDFIIDILPQNILNDILEFYKTSTYNSKEIIPVFYSDISSNGMLPGIRLQKVLLSTPTEELILDNVLMAVSQVKISEDLDVIFGKDINDMVGKAND